MKKMVLIFLGLAVIVTVGCGGKKIKLINTELKVSGIIEQPDLNNSGEDHSEGIQKNIYYRFDFETDTPLHELAAGTPSLVQVRLNFMKNGEEMASTHAFGPYSISKKKKSNLTKNMRGDYYSVLFFKSLEFYSVLTGLTIPVEKLDFDYLEIRVVFPSYFGPVFQSNITTYSREYILEQILKKRETLTIVE